MATQTEDFPTTPSAEIVGNAFVEQYYLILHKSPELVHRFYQDSSVLSRPGPDGSMTSVTTTEGIDKKILSLDYMNYKAEIWTADSQASHENGVFVLVTGCLTGNDDVRRKFTQSFFLAPQDKGYFVLNDVFRYVDEQKPVEISSVAVNDVGELTYQKNDDGELAPTPPLTPDPDPTPFPDQPELSHSTSSLEKNVEDHKEVHLPSDNVEVSAAELEVVPDPLINSSQNDFHPVAEKASPDIQEDAPKKSFASIVNALKGNTAPFHMRASHTKSVEQPRAVAATEAAVPVSNSSLEKNNDRTVKGHSIFIANLPMDATSEQLEGIFKKFGPIKSDGIQVRSHKNKGSCYGFVEYENLSSMQSALEASPIMIGDRRANIEEKRRDDNDTGNFQGGRGGFRNDNFRGRGNFSGGRGGYGRREFDKGGEFSGRNRGGGGRNGEAPQRGYGYQNGGARQPVKA